MRSRISIREVARAAGIPSATAGGYFSGRHLPPPTQPEALVAILRTLGVDDVGPWLAAVQRVRRRPGPPPRRPSPYLGMRSFDTSDADRFYGREHTVAELTALLRTVLASHRPNLVTVVAASGAGKSSLLRAGLVPTILAGGLDERAWTVRVLTPGLDPVAALTDAAQCSAGPRVLIVDQAEELFTVTADTAARSAFLDTVVSLADPEAAAPVVVVLALRADFYDTALTHAQLVPSLRHTQFVLPPMTRDEVTAAIVRPALAVDSSVEDGVVELVLRDASPAGGTPDPGTLPLISHALRAAWERSGDGRLTVADYLATGGIGDAVRRSAERLWAGLTDEQRAWMRQLLLRLVTVSETAVPTRRAAARADIAGLDAHRDVLDLFIAERLLVADAHVVQIGHEALLTAWPRLRDWVDEDRDGFALHRRVTRAATEWETGGHDEADLLGRGRLEALGEWVGRPENRQRLDALERRFLDASYARTARIARRARRRARAMRGLFAAVCVLLLVVGVLAALAVRSRNDADRSRDLAVSARDQALASQAATDAIRLRADDPATAAQLAVSAYRIAPTAVSRGSLLDTSGVETPGRLVGPAGAMEAVVVSPDGALVATGGDSGVVQLWSVVPRAGHRPLGQMTLGGPATAVFALVFAPDGRTLFAGGTGGAVRRWDISTPSHPILSGHFVGATATVYAFAMTSDGAVVAAATADGTVHRWQTADGGRPLPPLRVGAGEVHGVAFGDDDRLLAAGGTDDRIVVWTAPDAGAPRVVTTISAGSTVWALRFASRSLDLAAGLDDRRVELWSLAAPSGPRLIATSSSFTRQVVAVAFGSTDAQLLVGSTDSSTRVLDAHSLTTIMTLPGTTPVTSVAFDAATHSLVTASGDGIARLWPYPGPALRGPDSAAFSVQYDHRGDRLVVAGSGSGGTQLWSTANAAAPTLSTTLATTIADGSGTAAISPDGGTVAVGTADGQVLLYDVSDPAHPVAAPTLVTATHQLVEWLAFSPDGRILAAASNDHTVHLWDLSGGLDRPIDLPSLTGATNWVLAIGFSTDGRLLAAADAADVVRIWSVADPSHPEQVSTIGGFTSYVSAVEFSADDHLLAAGSSDRTARVYDVSDPAHPVQSGPTIAGASNYVNGVAFSPDGGTLGAAVPGSGLALYDLRGGGAAAPLALLDAGSDGANALAFDPRANGVVATAGNDQVLRFWQTDPSTVIAGICSAAGMPIWATEWARYVPGAPFVAPC